MLFSLYNNKTNVFMSLVEATDRESAVKMFVEIFNSPQPNQITQYFDEYILYEIGDFDKNTGALNSHPSPVSIINGLEAVKLWKQRKQMLDEIYSTPSLTGDEVSVDLPDIVKKGDSDECRNETSNVVEGAFCG